MNKALLLLLPFRPVFLRLELENRWWHRLSAVVFCTALLSAFLATAGLCYLTFAPQLSAMPDIWQTVNSSNVKSLKPGDPIRSDAQVGAPSDWVDVPQGAAGISPPPDGSAIVEPEQSKAIPIPSGAQIDNTNPQTGNPVSSEDLLSIPGSKTIQMPDGTNTAFPGSISDGTIKAHWIRAKRRQTFSSLGFAVLIAVATTLILSYALQAAYRALLYVIFGGKPVTSPGSITT